MGKSFLRMVSLVMACLILLQMSGLEMPVRAEEVSAQAAGTTHETQTQHTAVTIPAASHSFGDWIVTEAPACMTKGSERRDCENCDYFEVRDVEMTGHKYETIVTPPTCTEQGYTTYTCGVCGYSCVEDYIPATGHDIESVVIEATCTELGYTVNRCRDCGFEYIGSYEDAVGHDEVILEAVAPTCTTTGLTEGSYCAACGKVLEEQKTVGVLDHTYESVVTAPTCTAEGYTTYTCHCGESYVGAKTAALGHALGQWTVVTEPNPAQDGQERRNCARCDHFETRPVPYQGNAVKLEGEDLAKQKEVWIEGLPYPVITVGEEKYVELPNEKDCILVTYTYHNADNADVHTQYPTGMKVYQVSAGKLTHIKELDNLLQYSGSSIRITGKKGIRMITSITKANKTALTGTGLAGYKLVEYGTALCWAKEIKDGDALVLGRSFTRSNYAYKRDVADPVFAATKELVQYTNVLVGFTNDQCRDDIAMRPYIILENANGEKITLYGGTVYRSIGYIAYQNRNVVRKGTEAYKYVWDIIHHVYGNKFDADYKG